jgi:hypothetical protein
MRIAIVTKVNNISGTVSTVQVVIGWTGVRMPREL